MPVYHPLPAYLMKRLQRTQNAAAGFLINKYVNDVIDITKLGWLPAAQHREYQILKLTFKAIYFKQWPVASVFEIRVCNTKGRFAIKCCSSASNTADKRHFSRLCCTYFQYFTSLIEDLRRFYNFQ